MRGHKIIVLLLLLLLSTVSFAQVKVGDEAPEFEGTLVNRKYFSLHETVKDSIVVIFFMGYT